MNLNFPVVKLSNPSAAISYYQGIFGGNASIYDVSKSVLQVNESLQLQFIQGNDDHSQLVLDIEDEQELHHVYEKMSQTSVIHMPLQKTKRGSMHAVLTDQFGVTWALNFNGS